MTWWFEAVKFVAAAVIGGAVALAGYMQFYVPQQPHEELDNDDDRNDRNFDTFDELQEQALEINKIESCFQRGRSQNWKIVQH